MTAREELVRMLAAEEASEVGWADRLTAFEATLDAYRAEVLREAANHLWTGDICGCDSCGCGGCVQELRALADEATA